MSRVFALLAPCSRLNRVPAFHCTQGTNKLLTPQLRTSCVTLFNYRSVSFIAMSKETSSNQIDGSDQDTHPDPQAEAKTSSKSNTQDKHRDRNSLKKKRDTHFLCFPLVTDTSVPQLAESLRCFQNVTTKPSRRNKSETDKDEDEGTVSSEAISPAQPGLVAVAGDEGGQMSLNMNHSQPLSAANVELQILPALVHRPPGTFHLTLGVMDLSTEEEMERALNLLQELNYAEILREVVAQTDELETPLRRARHSEALDQDRTGRQASNEKDEKLSSLKRPVSPPPSLRSGTVDSIRQAFTRESPPQIHLTGLSTFPSAKSSRVFFAKPSPALPFPLLKFGQAIRSRFREAGFITETRPLVLHATVANMRYAVQARGGRTSKGKTWRYGKDRWKDGQVDARELIKCFDYYAGDVEAYIKGAATTDGEASEYIWAKGIDLNRVAICKMGAEKSDDPILGMVYPPVGERLIFE